MTSSQYLAAVHGLPCVICRQYFMVQLSQTQAHHVFHDRFSSARADHFATIPLCEGHHQGGFDRSKIAIHRDKALWRERYGPDHSYVPKTQERILGHVLR